MEKTWCPFKKENHETKCFPKKNCVLRSCDRCGVDKVNVSIPTGINQYKQVHYDQWVYKNRDEKYKMMNDGKTQPLKKVCEEYINKLDDMSTHLFFDQWQHNQFQQLIKNMEPGLVVFVHDFAKNILLRYQNEPQSHFWDHTQVTLHTTVAYYICPGGCGKVVTEYIYHITPDKSHDWKAVDHFTKLSIDHLQKKA